MQRGKTGVATIITTGSASRTSNAATSADLPHPEPEFPQPLLFGLLAFFTFAQILYEGMRFGLHAPGHNFTLPLLELVLHPAALRGDLIHLAAPLQTSPFWFALAWMSEQIGASYPVFLAVHILARWWAALAIFRLAERLFGHPMTALLAVVLWLGYNDVWPGGIALHRDYLTHDDMALALLLWSFVLWSEARGEWGFWCGIAACVDAPLSVFTFAVLWLVAWWIPPLSRPLQASSSRQRWLSTAARHIWHSAGERFSLGLRPIAGWLLVTVPLVAFLAPSLRLLSTQESASWGAFKLHASHSMQPFDEPTGGAWKLLALLAVGLWCWRRALRGSAARRAVAAVILVFGVFIAATIWLLAWWPRGAFSFFCPLRIAPLAASLCLLGVAHILKRAVARQGSGGLLAALLLIFGLIAVPSPSALLLVFGVLFIEVAGRADRERDGGRIPQSFAQSWRLWGLVLLVSVATICAAWPALASRLTGSRVAWTTVGWMLASLLAWVLTRERSARHSKVLRRWNDHSRQFDMGRFALLVFVIAFGMRARSGSGWRLREGDGALSAAQPSSWHAAQLWAKDPRHTPRNAVFVASKPGFRTFSRRAVFADSNDLRFAAVLPELRRRWLVRRELVDPLWNGSSLSTRQLGRLRARGVTHLVEQTARRWPRDARRKNQLRPIYSNRNWTIYKLRQ